MMFLLKKMIAPLIMPTSLCIELLVIGSVLLLYTKRQRLARTLLVGGTCLLLLFTNTLFSSALLWPLENKYPPLLAADLEQKGDLAWIVVLGGGHTSDDRLPCASQLNSPSLTRLIEAISLMRHYPEATLVLSGGNAFDPVPHARILADVALSMNVPAAKILMEPESRDTIEEVYQIAKVVEQEPFILVTSASHMPRAAALFMKNGNFPIPAPVNHRVMRITRFYPSLLFPSSEALSKTQVAVYEYTGLLWAWLRGKI